MPYALSFAPEFFWGDGSITPEDLPRSDQPTSVYQAILSLPDNQWAALGRDVFECNPDDLDPETVVTPGIFVARVVEVPLAAKVAAAPGAAA